LTFNIHYDKWIHDEWIKVLVDTYHTPNHHDEWTEVLVDTEQIKDADVPEDDVNAVEDSTLTNCVGKQPHCDSNAKEEDGDCVADIPHLGEVNAQFLGKLLRLRHNQLQ